MLNDIAKFVKTSLFGRLWFLGFGIFFVGMAKISYHASQMRFGGLSLVDILAMLFHGSMAVFFLLMAVWPEIFITDENNGNTN